MQRAKRNDSRGIDVVVRDVIMPFNMVEVDRVGDAVDLVEISQVAEQVAIVDDPAEITLEMAVVDGIKPYQRHEEPPIRFGDL